MEITNSILKEQTERNKKKKNVIIFGVEESNGREENKRVEHDENIVKNILAKIKLKTDESKSIDVAMISESWFNEMFMPNIIVGYKFYFCNRKKVEIGGGVCIYIKENLESNKVDDPLLLDSKLE
ncbi:unnamed protein product [Brachionus calyciflorus]|uniref:Uncharacterized protein n=1 Tax=Brachionus calyciflorus TaxID=104777 RepID=A0A814DJR2_9BILA|nr:unnamed protein product [Brachionus calyciflorus]